MRGQDDTIEELDCTQVLGFPVNERRLGPAHAVRTVLPRIQADGLDPGFDNPGVLPRRQMRGCRYPAGKQKLTVRQIEQRQFSRVVGHLQAGTEGPDFLELERRLLAQAV